MARARPAGTWLPASAVASASSCQAEVCCICKARPPGLAEREAVPDWSLLRERGERDGASLLAGAWVSFFRVKKDGKGRGWCVASSSFPPRFRIPERCRRFLRVFSHPPRHAAPRRAALGPSPCRVCFRLAGEQQIQVRVPVQGQGQSSKQVVESIEALSSWAHSAWGRNRSPRSVAHLPAPALAACGVQHAAMIVAGQAPFGEWPQGGAAAGSDLGGCFTGLLLAWRRSFGRQPSALPWRYARSVHPSRRSPQRLQGRALLIFPPRRR